MNLSESNEDSESYYGYTPQVVSNFSLPNANINKDGPFLQIVEQPQTKFRFRYRSEMVGTHGQLKAESTDRNRNVYPAVKLCNWNGSPALIRLMLYTAEDNGNERKRHVHELNGKNCNKEGFVEVVVDDSNNYTAVFPNLGIIHIAKRDKQTILYQRKEEQLVNLARINNPNLRNQTVQHNVSPTDLQKLKEVAEEEAKMMDLNKVVLRFQAYFYLAKEKCYRPITEYIDSEVIFNLKNASTGELRIVRISSVSAPCTGGTEIWMLVEKVKKSNVKVKFYEVDEDMVVWKGYGEFKESDVHHQYAIIFRTPPYRDTNIREPVHVKLQLERTTDNDTSEPLDFTYIPENLKRSNIYLETKMECGIGPYKKSRFTSAGEPMNLKKKRQLFYGSEEMKHSPETPYQSPQHMVPSPGAPADSPGYQGFYSPPQQNSTYYHPSLTISGADDDPYLFLTSQEESSQMAVGQQYNINCEDGAQNNGYVNQHMENLRISPTFQSLQMKLLSPYSHRVPSPLSLQQSSPYGMGNIPSPGGSVTSGYSDSSSIGHQDTALEQILQFDAVHKEVIRSKTHSPQDFDFSDLVNGPYEVNHHDDMDLLDVIQNTKLFGALKGSGDIHADGTFSNSKVKLMKNNEDTKNDVDDLMEKLSSVSIKENKGRLREDSTFSYKDIAVAAAQLYSVSKDPEMLLYSQGCLLRVANIYGDNCLHTAVSNRDRVAFDKILKASEDLKCRKIFSAQNSDGETPLHIAIRQNQVEMVKLLLEAPGSCLGLSISNYYGNNCLHAAAYLSTPHCLSTLLNQPINGITQSIRNIINQYNYEGQTPLHVAVLRGNLTNVSLLLGAGAEAHKCERKQGANALHLATMMGVAEIAKYLIENTSIDVNVGLLDGTTALHIAAEAKDEELCSILMEAKADPFAKSSARKIQEYAGDDDDDDLSNDDDDDCLSPIDCAESDPKILSILRQQEVMN